MEIIYNKVFLEHETGLHPENKKRLTGLGISVETDIIDGSLYPRLVHNLDYIDKIQFACENKQQLDPDTFTSEGSFRAAMAAVGATVMASETGGFAAVRPPGHHAYPNHASGFCLFNNIAIATTKLVNEGKRVMIFDFDGHLGDGTYHIFKESDKVLFWSLHQYPAYPGGGSEDDIGDGKGRGFSVNVPLPAHTGDDIFRNAVEHFLPIARQFAPDVVAVSAGFDAHHSDPLLELRLSLNSFYYLGEMFKREFTNVFAVLEGGYNLEYMPQCLHNFVDGYNGAPQRFNERPTESEIQLFEEFEFRMHRVETNLREYWDV